MDFFIGFTLFCFVVVVLMFYVIERHEKNKPYDTKSHSRDTDTSGPNVARFFPTFRGTVGH